MPPTRVNDNDPPLSVRRSRRSSSGPQPNYREEDLRKASAAAALLATHNNDAQQRPSPVPKSVSTPRKTKKRVRFSDPGSELSPSTDLAPMVRRISLTVAIPATTPHSIPKQRKPTSSTPRRTASRAPKSGLGAPATSSPLGTSIPLTPTPSTPRSAPRSSSAPTPGSMVPASGSVSFLPLRQVLDGRIQRRMRRSGLSEEMNRIHGQKTRRARQAAEELQRLRAAVKEKDGEIYRLQNETIVVDTDRVWELEREIGDLRSQLGTQGLGQRRVTVGSQDVPSSPTISTMGNESRYEWTLAARDPYAISNAYSDVDVDMTEPDLNLHNYEDDVRHMNVDEGFGDETIAEFASGTPTISRKRTATASTGSGTGLGISLATTSFPTPPATSPAGTMPNTPCSDRFARFMSPQTPTAANMGTQADLRTASTSMGVQAGLRMPSSEASIQVELSDPEKEGLRDEVVSMRLEMAKLAATIESYETLMSRLSAKLDAASITDSTNNIKDNGSNTEESVLEARLTAALTTLSARTTSLLELTSSLSNLGFSGSSPASIITSISTSLRSARLELEYLTPGEIALPLASSGAKTLDLLLTRLRHLSRRLKESDAQIDEYHAIEQSLRAQLGARAEVMEKGALEREDLEGRLQGRESELQRLEVSVARLRGAVGGYERDIKELESLVERMECEAVATAQDLALSKTETSNQKMAATQLQERLEMVEGEARHLAEERDDAVTKGQEDVCEREDRITALRAEIVTLQAEVKILEGRVEDGVREMATKLGELRQEKNGAEARGRVEREKARLLVGRMREELVGILGMSGEFLGEKGQKGEYGDVHMDGATCAAPLVAGGFLSGKLARRGSVMGASKRKYDSGIGVEGDTIV